MRDCDLVLLRSPAHFGLVGAALVRTGRKPSVTKWAGENGSYAGERIPSRADRLLQGLRSDRNPVLVYGPPKREHQISFLPALMSREELTRGRELAWSRRWEPPWRILAVGRLTPVKGFDLALRGLGLLRRSHPRLEWTLTLVGDGVSRPELERLSRACGIDDRVTFAGALPFAQVQTLYATSHAALMPGTKEGWPKVIAEAWAHGSIPVAAARGLVPWILGEEGSGVTFEPTPEALAEALAWLLENSSEAQAMSEGLFRRAVFLGLDRFQERLEELLVERFGWK